MDDSYEFLKALNHKEYLSKISREYGIAIPMLEALEKDFDLNEKGQHGPWWDDVFPKDVVAESGLPEKLLMHFRQIGVIGWPVTYLDMDFLRRYLLLVDGEDGCNKPKCRQVHVELKESWQIYIYLRYLKNKIYYKSDGTMINPEDRIYVKSLVREVRYRFSIESTNDLKIEIKKIKNTGNNDKRKSREQKISIEQVALQRGIDYAMFANNITPQSFSVDGVQLKF